MRPLTDSCPKPLLSVYGRPLIVWQITQLVRCGFTEIVINHAHLGHMIEESLGDGSRFGARIQYSAEGTALETAGGIAKALPLLGDEPFLVVSGDIYCPHFDYAELRSALVEHDHRGDPIPPDQRDVAWIMLVKNPPYHPEGDFALNSFWVANQGEPRLTFANIGVYRPEMFAGIAPGTHAKLGPLLRQYADRRQVGGELYRGTWANVGTVADLEQLNLPPAGSVLAAAPGQH